MSGLTAAAVVFSGSSLAAGLTYAPDRRATDKAVDMALYAAGGIVLSGALDRSSCDLSMARLEIDDTGQIDRLAEINEGTDCSLTSLAGTFFGAEFISRVT